LLDVKTRQWSPKVVDYVADDLSEKLPPLLSSKLPNGTLREELCRKWGVTKAPSVSAGGGDNMMAAIGTGNIESGVVTASLGTSGTLFAFSTVPIIDPLGEVAAFCDSTDDWLPLICTLNLTLITEHVCNLFGWDYAQLEEQIRAVPAGCDGLLLLPYLTGERTPDLPNGTGVFHGLTLANFTASHMARAAFEGVTLGLGYGLARFRELGMHPAEIRLTGAEVIAGYGAKCALTFSACRQCASKAEKGPGSAGPFRRDGFGTMNRDRVPRWRKSASGSYR
jgi:xylulokinase